MIRRKYQPCAATNALRCAHLTRSLARLPVRARGLHRDGKKKGGSKKRKAGDLAAPAATGGADEILGDRDTVCLQQPSPPPPLK